MSKLRLLSLIFFALSSALPCSASDAGEVLFDLAPRSRLPEFSMQSSTPQEIFFRGATHVRGLAEAARGKAEQVQTKIDRDLSSIRDIIPTPQVSTGINVHVDRMKVLMERIGSDIQGFERLLK